MGYDDAVFRQALLKLTNNKKTASRSQIYDAFWTACWDLKLAIEQQAPEKWEQATETAMEVYVPAFAAQLEGEGWEIQG